MQSQSCWLPYLSTFHREYPTFFTISISQQLQPHISSYHFSIFLGFYAHSPAEPVNLLFAYFSILIQKFWCVF
jgi:hypothetical protein